MKLDKIHTVYFLGIGGIGMSALARFFLLQGKQVFGYDLTPTEITSQLMVEGAHIHFEEDVSKIPAKIDVVVYTPAVPKEHKEYQYFVEHQIPLLKRSEILGIICGEYPTIAIAGTHGKTTTTAMVTQILFNYESRITNYELRPETQDSNILSFIGGIAKNFNSNFVCAPDFDTVIVEADEFDRSFLTLYPQVAIITSTDADHLDVYGNRKSLLESFQLFANQIQPDGVLVINDEIADQIEHPNKVTYGFSEQAHYKISDIQNFPLPGMHNALNAVAALAACVEFSLWKDKKADLSNMLSFYKEKLSGFTGVKRRFDVRVQRDDFVYIDDYAHHPEAIKAFLDAVKKSYPEKKITGVFQPHLYSRTRDFVQEFADSLDILDEIILLDIYPAREKPIEGITSNYLLSLIKNENKKLLKKEELVSYLQQNKPEVLLTMGAGDIDRIVKELGN
jgi:UDP-N-acetylmuramate--alanine ligase